MDKKRLELAKQLYKPSPKVEALVLDICKLFDTPLSNGVVINGLRFDDNYLKLGGCVVKSVVRDTTHHCGIEVHWQPNFNISTKNDPFCSAFILKYNSLQKLYNELKTIFSKMQETHALEEA